MDIVKFGVYPADSSFFLIKNNIDRDAPITRSTDINVPYYPKVNVVCVLNTRTLLIQLIKMGYDIIKDKQVQVCVCTTQKA
jgi:hypothetical protein